MRTITFFCLVLFLGGCKAHPSPPEEPPSPPDPVAHIYREVGGEALQAYVLSPPLGVPENEPASAILLFHGGGWSAGMPDWTFGAAQRFADHGMVAIPIQYRLSAGEMTPIEALADVCAAFRWAADTLTPLSGAQGFCRRLIELGRTCDLNVFEGVGHLLTRNLAYQEGDFDPDPAAVAEGVEDHLHFLETLGFIAPE